MDSYQARTIHSQIYTSNIHFSHVSAGEFGIVYKGFLAGQYSDEVVAIKTLKGEVKFNINLRLHLLNLECITYSRSYNYTNHNNIMHLGYRVNVVFAPYIIIVYMFLTGFINESGIQELLSECAIMKNFDNLHVMSLKGVCLDGGPVPYIVLPYMTNGNLLSYLKKKRHDLVVMEENNTENEAHSQVGLL